MRRGQAFDLENSSGPWKTASFVLPHAASEMPSVSPDSRELVLSSLTLKAPYT